MVLYPADPHARVAHQAQLVAGHVTHLRRLLEEEDVVIPPEVWTATRVLRGYALALRGADARALRAQGLSFSQIGRALGVHKETARVWVRGDAPAERR
jgi:hypothetical protein